MPEIKTEPLELAGVILIRPRPFADPRGSFCETYRRSSYAAAGIDADFIQDNEALSHDAGTIRGLHFQAPPQAQAKLVHVLRGSVFDVAVDLRRGSPTYGKWCGVRLTAAGGEQIFVPHGFAHGYCTLEADTVVTYKVDGVLCARPRGRHPLGRRRNRHRLAGRERAGDRVGEGWPAARLRGVEISLLANRSMSRMKGIILAGGTGTRLLPAHPRRVASSSCRSTTSR